MTCLNYQVLPLLFSMTSTGTLGPEALRYKRSALLGAAMLVVLRRQEGFSAVKNRWIFSRASHG